MNLPPGLDGAQLFALMAKNNKEGVLLYDDAGTISTSTKRRNATAGTSKSA